MLDTKPRYLTSVASAALLKWTYINSQYTLINDTKQTGKSRKPAYGSFKIGLSCVIEAPYPIQN